MTDVHAQAKRGIKLLMGRQVLLQIVTFSGGIVLARVLGPAQFGLYQIAAFLVAAFSIFGDFGLASTLIQRKEDLTELDIRVAFTLQFAVTTVIVAALFITAPWLAHFYPKAPPATVWLVRALSLSLYLTSWRTMSAVQLERHLKYDRIARVEVIESLAYQGTAVILALTRHGVWSYAIAVLVSGITGTVLMYAASPWLIKFGFDGAMARKLVRTGVPFQVQMIINSLGDWVTPLFVGRIIGPAAVGYIIWASSNGKKPMLLVSNVVRVAFPHFSRIQHDRAEVERVLERYFSHLLIAGGLWLAVIVTASPAIVRIVYTSKWLPAVPPLMVYAFALCFDIIGWLSTSTLNAIGKTQFANKVYLFRSFANIILAIVFVIFFGFIGVAVASFVTITFSAIWLLEGLGQGTSRRILTNLSWLIPPVVVGIICGKAIGLVPSPMLFSVILCAFLTIFSYLATLWITMPSRFKSPIFNRLQEQWATIRGVRVKAQTNL